MAASEAVIVDAGGRDLRVSSPDRVIFPKTKRTGAVTKLDYARTLGADVSRRGVSRCLSPAWSGFNANSRRATARF